MLSMKLKSSNCGDTGCICEGALLFTADFLESSLSIAIIPTVSVYILAER